MLVAKKQLDVWTKMMSACDSKPSMHREHVLEFSFSVEPNYVGMTFHYAVYVGVIV